MSDEHKVAWLCEALLVSRSGYCQWRRRQERPGRRQAENLQLKVRIREAFAQSRVREV